VGEDGRQPRPERPLAAPLKPADLAEDDEQYVLNQVARLIALTKKAMRDTLARVRPSTREPQ
jgi:hypothetical protein